MPEKRAIRAGHKLGEMEEYFLSQLTPGDTFLFGGEVLSLVTIEGLDALCVRATGDRPAIPSYNGGKFPLTTFLADRVRHMIHNPSRVTAAGQMVVHYLKRIQFSQLPSRELELRG